MISKDEFNVVRKVTNSIAKLFHNRFRYQRVAITIVNQRPLLEHVPWSLFLYIDFYRIFFVTANRIACFTKKDNFSIGFFLLAPLLSVPLFLHRIALHGFSQ